MCWGLAGSSGKPMLGGLYAPFTNEGTEEEPGDWTENPKGCTGQPDMRSLLRCAHVTGPTHVAARPRTCVEITLRKRQTYVNRIRKHD